MNVVPINAEPRTETGKKAAKNLRKTGKIPAVLYSKNGVSHFCTTHNAVKSIIFTPDLKLAEIEINGESKKAIVKKVDFHPVTDAIEHIDFLELVDGHALKAHIPVHFTGESPGVVNGGKFNQTLRTVEVKTTPEHLVDEIFVDISSMTLGTAVRVRDIEVPEGIEILVEGGTPIANVAIPRVLKEEDELDEELLEGEEGEEGAAAEGEEAKEE